MKRSVYQSSFVLSAIGVIAALIVSGCGSNTPTSGLSGTGAAVTNTVSSYSETLHAKVEFESPYRLKTVDGGFIEVDSPGYACPTIADVDGDGDADLIVGQFAGGNMRIYRNESAAGTTPRFSNLEWITCGGKRAEVPGVS